MASLARSLRRGRPEARVSGSSLSLQQVIDLFSFGGHTYPLFGAGSLVGQAEEITGDWDGLIRGAYKRDGVVFAVMLTRMLLFSEARFAFRRRTNGRAGDLFTNDSLRLLEHPYPGGKTSDLLSRAIQDTDLGGNWFGVRMRGGIRRLRPDWVTIILGSQEDPDNAGQASDAEVVGYLYHPGGHASADRVESFLPDEVAHWAPIPDPDFAFRGMSWLWPVIREVMADVEMTEHQLRFFEKGATPNMVVSFAPEIEPEQFEAWVKAFEADHEGTANAYKTLFLAGGAKVDVVGSSLQQLDFKSIKGHGETRIAAAAGVPPVIVGLSEGLAAATYSNYGQARRRFADGTMRPLWRGIAEALETIVNLPAGTSSELWYDVREVSFLQEDEQDKADIQATKAQTARSLVEAGYEPGSVIEAIENDDMTRLVHSGLYSVQLQAPGAGTTDDVAPDDADDEDEPAEPPANGNGNGAPPSRALEALAATIRRSTEASDRLTRTIERDRRRRET